MSNFQPGDVVRLTHSIVSITDRGILGGCNHHCSCGKTVIEPEGECGRVDEHLAGPPSPRRPDMRERLRAVASERNALQAVLDAILDKSIPAPVDGYQMAPLMSRGWPIPVIARKVDGHWQVKSVGGGE